MYFRCRAIEEARSSLKQCGQCTLSLLAGLSGSGRDREETCPEDLRLLVELEAASELSELLSSSAPETQVATYSRTIRLDWSSGTPFNPWPKNH